MGTILNPNGQASGPAALQNHPAAAQALAASGVISTEKGVLYRISMLNTNVGTRYLQLFDADAAPADTAVPLMSIPVAAGAWVNVDLGMYGKAFVNGMSWCTSSTAGTKTIGAAEALVEASFKAG